MFLLSLVCHIAFFFSNSLLLFAFLFLYFGCAYVYVISMNGMCGLFFNSHHGYSFGLFLHYTSIRPMIFAIIRDLIQFLTDNHATHIMQDQPILSRRKKRR